LTLATADNITLRAELKPKTLRKALVTIEQHGPENILVAFQGKLAAKNNVVNGPLYASATTEKRDQIKRLAGKTPSIAEVATPETRRQSWPQISMFGLEEELDQTQLEARVLIEILDARSAAV
jgi:hypothetical protein